MIIKRAITTIGTATLIALAVPGIAEAHNATASGSCQGGVQWTVTNFNRDLVNSIVVRIDGTIVYQDLDFKASASFTHPWIQTAPHAWSVTVNAPGTEFDRSFSGTWQACQTAPTTTSGTVAPSTTVVQVTTVPITVPDTTVVNDPTTTVVAVDLPPVPSTVLLVPPVTIAGEAVEPVLPRTGANDTFIYGAALLLFAGLVLLGVRGRRV